MSTEVKFATNKEKRKEFGNILKKIPGVKTVAFQPPADYRLKYPAIIYSRDDDRQRYADDEPYIHTWRYNVLAIDSDPDSTIPDTIRATFRYCELSRVYTASNLYHYSFVIYY